MFLIYARIPPKAAKKKTRVEMREELYLALQQAAQASQQAPKASQQVPEATQQASVLPLVLPVPSTHSTTGSTGPGPPTRSIRYSFVTTQPPTEPGRDVS